MNALMVYALIKSKVSALTDRAETAATKAETEALISEGYAKGTQDGTPAASGEDYYEDNAKYYKEQAEAAATIAQNLSQTVYMANDGLFYIDVSE